MLKNTNKHAKQNMYENLNKIKIHQVWNIDITTTFVYIL